MLIWKTADGVMLQLPREIQAGVQKRLQMFVLRAKAKLSDVTQNRVMLGLSGPAAATALMPWFPTLPVAIYGKIETEAGTLIRHPNAFEVPRYQWITTEAQAIEAGMPVEVSPLNMPQQKFGYLRGTVRSVGQFPSNTSLASNFMVNNIPVIEVRVALEPDESVFSGYTWSIGSGPDRPLQIGVAATVNIIVDSQRPIERILPIFQ